MMQSVSKPIPRGPIKLALGKLLYVNKRRLSWYLTGKRFAKTRSPQKLPHLHATHATPMLRPLSGVDMQLQQNKKESLRIAASSLDGLIIDPGETFSFWRLVGKPTARRGFKVGLVLRNGKIMQDIGGGLCQMTNLIYWMTIHTDLEVTERWRHSYDVFPDAARTQPFASGATCAYNYIDLQIRNTTGVRYQLNLWQEADWLHGSWRSDQPARHSYRVTEKNHRIAQEWWGGYSRHNELWRSRHAADSDLFLAEEFLTENHAIMMYEPLLAKQERKS